jgi:MtN3 and saliva related transmembrane protein
MAIEYFKYLIELMFGLSLFANAMLFIPQAVKIYKTKNTRGLSKITFFGFNVMQIFTILHAYIHEDIVTFLIFSYNERSN